MKAIVVERFGGPEVLRLVDVSEPRPSDGQIALNVSAAGVNYADTHQAENSYHAPARLPLIPGAEVVGTAPGGQRVVALLPGGGGYAERALVSPGLSVAVPDGVKDGQALAVILQGLTAWHLLRTSARIQPGESVVVHAAAGGVGTLAIQLARRFGAGRVIAAASTAEKRALALDLGADDTVHGQAADLTGAILEANRGEPVDIVLEMVGGSTFAASYDALAPFGRLVSYGVAGRRIPDPVDVVALNRDSRGVLGFWLAHCFRSPAMFRPPVRELLGLVADGALRTVVGAVYPLGDARRAHEDLRARRTVGKLVLDPRA
jgi:NADPH2:quinone reductase